MTILSHCMLIETNVFVYLKTTREPIERYGDKYVMKNNCGDNVPVKLNRTDFCIIYIFKSFNDPLFLLETRFAQKKKKKSRRLCIKNKKNNFYSS